MVFGSNRLKKVKYSELEKSVGWLTDRVTISHFVNVMGAVFIWGRAHHTNDPIEGFTPNFARLLLSGLSCFAALAGVYIEVFQFPWALKTDERFKFFHKNVFGYFLFLTLWCETVCCIYVAFGFLAELSTWPQVGMEPMWWLHRFCYALSPFANSTAVTLAILFMKFCWFDKEWHNGYIVLWTERGWPGIVYKSLYTHLIWIVLSVLDIVYLRSWFPHLTYPLQYQLQWSSFFAVFYISCMFAFREWSGLWPYPFLAHFSGLHKTIFFSVIFVFVNGMTCGTFYAITAGRTP